MRQTLSAIINHIIVTHKQDHSCLSVQSQIIIVFTEPILNFTDLYIVQTLTHEILFRCPPVECEQINEEDLKRTVCGGQSKESNKKTNRKKRRTSGS